MNPFLYTRSLAVTGAIQSLAKEPHAYFLAGGTNLIDLMKMGVVLPERLVDINGLPLKGVEKTATGLRIGALATNSEVADHPLVLEGYPLLSLAINAGASPQLRNMATVGGNLMQRTRCNYFFDTAMPCNKRSPGSGCGALTGYNRMHALFGASDLCIAVNPSDMNVAMVALDAVVHVKGPKGGRSIKFADFHRLPGDHPEKDNTLERGELITAVELPAAAQAFNRHVHYEKIRPLIWMGLRSLLPGWRWAGLRISHGVCTMRRHSCKGRRRTKTRLSKLLPSLCRGQKPINTISLS